MKIQFLDTCAPVYSIFRKRRLVINLRRFWKEDRIIDDIGVYLYGLKIVCFLNGRPTPKVTFGPSSTVSAVA